MKYLKNITFLFSLSSFSAAVAILGGMFTKTPIHLFFGGMLILVLIAMLVEGHKAIALIVFAGALLGYAIAYWNQVWLFVYWNSAFVSICVVAIALTLLIGFIMYKEAAQ